MLHVVLLVLEVCSLFVLESLLLFKLLLHLHEGGLKPPGDIGFLFFFEHLCLLGDVFNAVLDLRMQLILELIVVQFRIVFNSKPDSKFSLKVPNLASIVLFSNQIPLMAFL